MWEDYPRALLKWIFATLAILFGAFVTFSLVRGKPEELWDYLTDGGVVLIAIPLIPLTAWLVVKGLKLLRSSRAKPGLKHDG
jgi:hypothetical protein